MMLDDESLLEWFDWWSLFTGHVRPRCSVRRGSSEQVLLDDPVMTSVERWKMATLSTRLDTCYCFMPDFMIGPSILATKMTNCSRPVLSGPRLLDRLLKVDRKKWKRYSPCQIVNNISLILRTAINRNFANYLLQITFAQHILALRWKEFIFAVFRVYL